MPFVDKAKNLIRTFLGTQADKYILTEGGLKLQISDYAYSDKSANAGSGWTDKTKSS